MTGYAFSPYNIDRDINRKTKVIMHMGYMEGNKEDYTEMCGYYECEDAKCFSSAFFTSLTHLYDTIGT